MGVQILSWLVAVLPVALGLVMILVPAKHEDEKNHMRWRRILGACLILYGVLVGAQQYLAARAAKNDRDDAIQKTSAAVTEDVTKSVTKSVADLYQKQVAALEDQIGDLKVQLARQGEKVNAISNSNIVTGKNPVRVQVTNPPQPPEINAVPVKATQNLGYGKNAFGYLVTINQVMHGVHVVVTCSEGKINIGTTAVLNAAAIFNGGGPAMQDDHTYMSNISFPNWSPENPLVVTLYTNSDTLGVCKFGVR